LEVFYYCYRIYPFVGKNFRSIKKEPKLYLWDWSEIQAEGARFENCIASHLLKLIHFLQDYEGHRAALYYLRTVDKKEVDFLVAINDKPWFAVEAKLNDTKPSPHLRYFTQKLDIPFVYQVVKNEGVDIYQNHVRIVSADRFLAGLV
jgi:predicted AAA+ superfamily ATPase